MVKKLSEPNTTPVKRLPLPMTEKTWHVRQAILQRYGGHCVCPCGCQEINLRRLQIDHIHNDGGVERNQKKVRGERYYVRLLNTPVDPTLQLLCANCHMEKTMFGQCEGQQNQLDISSVTGVTYTSEEPLHQQGLPVPIVPEPIDQFPHTREPWIAQRAAEHEARRRASHVVQPPKRRHWYLLWIV